MAHAAPASMSSGAPEVGAFEDLYRAHLAPLYAYMLVALKDHHRAEDAAHEVFVRVLRTLDRYEERGVPFQVWIFRIARNHVIDLHRRERPEDAAEPAAVWDARDAQVVRELPSDSGPGWADDGFARLVEDLPVGQRQVLVLRYVLDMSFRDIALVMDSNEPAVRNQQRRAFATLRARLQAQARAERAARGLLRGA